MNRTPIPDTYIYNNILVLSTLMACMYYSFSWAHKNILDKTGLIIISTNQIEDTNKFCQQCEFLRTCMTGLLSFSSWGCCFPDTSAIFLPGDFFFDVRYECYLKPQIASSKNASQRPPALSYIFFPLFNTIPIFYFFV